LAVAQGQSYKLGFLPFDGYAGRGQVSVRQIGEAEQQ
jgi:hypothetical protein